ncbi:Asp23/Gls24 family envelope stress response protein [Amycolatopsis nigrescens]|uniref:Asp23/Gls24 family envelope stress response protein n=1 Tax=Amycolatopsis nigrescens TaxID=381445 RepID=UPI00036862B3|nr:Asp23/Gls24 family envelope stress response protein [Amycolatopsis nigrescens]
MSVDPTGLRTEYVISDTVVASVAARAAAATPGVVRTEPGLVGLVSAWGRTARQRWKGLTPAPADGVSVRFENDTADTVSVRVDLVVGSADQAAAVAQAVQRAVSRAVLAATGLNVSTVDVSILDIEPGAR